MTIKPTTPLKVTQKVVSRLADQARTLGMTKNLDEWCSFNLNSVLKFHIV